MYKLPILSPRKPILTLPYGDKSMLDWYKEKNIPITEHNGVDFICGTPVQTYGTPLVCPFPKAKVIKLNWESVMSTNGNGVTIEYKKSGINFKLVLWHTGEIDVKIGQELKEGDVICYIGNSGACRPEATPQAPYNGSHLHMMLFKNGVLIDPFVFFNKNEWYLGLDSGPSHDIEPLKWSWSIRGITDWWIKMIEAFIHWK